MEIINDLKEVLKIVEVLKEADLKSIKQIQIILNKWIKVFEDFKTQEDEARSSKTIKNNIYNIHPYSLTNCKCCSKKKLSKKTLIFLCPYPCASISKEKPNHKCLKCGKPYYPILFKKSEGWMNPSLKQLKCQQLQLSNMLLQKKSR